MSQQYGPFYATIQVAFVFPGQGSQFGLSGLPWVSIPRGNPLVDLWVIYECYGRSFPHMFWILSQMGVSENSVAMRSPKLHELDQTNNHHICSLWMGQRNPPASLGCLKPYEPSGMVIIRVKGAHDIPTRAMLHPWCFYLRYVPYSCPIHLHFPYIYIFI